MCLLICYYISILSIELKIKILFLYFRFIYVFSMLNKNEGVNILIKLYIKEIYNFEYVFINE